MKFKPASPAVLWTIVLAQFCCTSLWFASNAVIGPISEAYGLSETALGHLTSTVQLGFIGGTLIFAWYSFSDRFSPSRVFFVSALLGAMANLGLNWVDNTLESLLAFRFLTGFFLAGIYPVGMKIAADHFDKNLGRSLGFLVGALVLGTAFPHLVEGVNWNPDFRNVIWSISLIAALGGLVVLIFVGDGPHRQAGRGFRPRAMFALFKQSEFKYAAFGYFGHMWELYAFWTFAPVVMLHMARSTETSLPNPSLWSFGIIAIGSIGCVLAGLGSPRYGIRKMAFIALSLSGLCCLLSPLIFGLSALWPALILLIFWGVAVIPDSPMFSSLVAKNANPDLKGTALTLVNGIGFALTIVSIQLINWISIRWSFEFWLFPLVAGPILGLWCLRRMGS
ncbi:MFS transporter [Aureitalea marina]|uniref:MFS transporter n=1 Tax=Aureitalea marina TaxID=930804 RepID=A0A2S7KMD5_9FLAO|nr:MFS transporter [Aureitalea marina]PQB03795.1 MFS transporter [Aureitalea marina]